MYSYVLFLSGFPFWVFPNRRTDEWTIHHIEMQMRVLCQLYTHFLPNSTCTFYDTMRHVTYCDDYIPIIYQLYTNYIPIIYQLYTNYIPIIYQLYTNYIPIIYLTNIFTNSQHVYQVHIYDTSTVPVRYVCSYTTINQLFFSTHSSSSPYFPQRAFRMHDE
jgi:hypothetical protein